MRDISWASYASLLSIISIFTTRLDFKKYTRRAEIDSRVVGRLIEWVNIREILINFGRTFRILCSLRSSPHSRMPLLLLLIVKTLRLTRWASLFRCCIHAYRPPQIPISLILQIHCSINTECSQNSLFLWYAITFNTTIYITFELLFSRWL
jgi:hypothetical protein